MLEVTINGETRTFHETLTVAALLDQLGHDRRRVAVEVNREVVPATTQANRRLQRGDAVEIVTLVGGGSSEQAPADKPLIIGKFRFQSRLITGTGKYANYQLM